MADQRLVAWVGFVARHSTAWLAGIAIVTLVMGWIAYNQFRMNSDLGQLIDQTSSWRVDFDAFKREFPDLVHTAVVVVKGTSFKGVESTTQAVVAYLQAREDRYTAVTAPAADAFFRDHAFLYMPVEELDDAIDRLAQAQPLMSAVTKDPSLTGIFDLLRDGFENEMPTGMETVLRNLTLASQRSLDASGGDATPILWTDEFFPLAEPIYRLVFLKPQSRFSATLPNAEVVAGLREMVDSMDLPDGVEIRLTGEITLQHEEIEAAIEGVSMAGWLALVLLFVVLLVGVRSGKIILATFSMLAIGIIWTSAYAMLSVGEYNTLSLVFIVMFFGLGVDFALHFSLRFQEAVNKGNLDVVSALSRSTRSVGRAISLCTLTTAIGFLGFWPTAYQGLADLGVISAGGMVIAWFLTFTYLPAFYARFGNPRAHEMDLPTSEGVVNWLISRRGRVITAVAVTGVLASVVASQARFDYSTLALKDPQSESMQMLRELQREGQFTDYQLVIMSAASIDAEPLLSSGVVDTVTTPSNLVPQQQEDKLAALADLQIMLWDVLQAEPMPTADMTDPPPSRIEESRAAAAALLASIESGLPAQMDAAVVSEFVRSLAAMLEAPDQAWTGFADAVLSNLLEEMQWLDRALTVETISWETLPDSVRDRSVSASDLQLTVVKPREDIADVDALSSFITAVREIHPHATGRPVLEWGVGNIVLKAFREALVFAVLGIGLVLALALRRTGPTLLVLCPLVLTGVYAFAIGVVLEMPVNMANVLVLPLIFGLGVDNGIHVVDRFLGEGDVDHLMHSSTPRAVLLSTMTTIGAFAALSISPHQGTASIGLLLTISVSFLLIFTVFLLPVLLSLLPQRD